MFRLTCFKNYNMLTIREKNVIIIITIWYDLTVLDVLDGKYSNIYSQFLLTKMQLLLYSSQKLFITVAVLIDCVCTHVIVTPTPSTSNISILIRYYVRCGTIMTVVFHTAALHQNEII